MFKRNSSITIIFLFYCFNVRCEINRAIPSLVNSPTAVIVFHNFIQPSSPHVSNEKNERRFLENNILWNYGSGTLPSDVDISSSNANVNMNINRNDAPTLTWHTSSSKTTRGHRQKRRFYSQSLRNREQRMRHLFQIIHPPLPNMALVNRHKSPRHWYSRARRSGLTYNRDNDKDNLEDEVSRGKISGKLVSKILKIIRDIENSISMLKRNLLNNINKL